VLQHAPSEARVHLVPDVDHAVLRFSIALRPEMWRPDCGDGLRFVVAADDGVHRKTLFQRTIDPKHKVAERRWIAGQAKLQAYLGREIDLILRTDPLANNWCDQAGWGDLRLESAEGSHQFRLVYRGEADVYENLRAHPRAFLVGAARQVEGEAAAAAALREPGFDPFELAAVEGTVPADIPTLPRPGLAAGSARMVEYGSERVVVAVQAAAPSVLVVADTYYPGWWADVDGRAAPLYPTDLAFRGVPLPAGEHTVVFTYAPRSFAAGLAIAALALLALAAMLALITRAARSGRAP